MTDQPNTDGCGCSCHQSGITQGPNGRSPAEGGFSLLELVVVVSILLVLGAIAVENVQNAVGTARLQGTAISYSNLLQEARIRAVRDDKYYTVLTTAGNSTTPPIAFIDIAGTGTYAAGDPMMTFASGVAPMSFGSGPNVAGLEALFLPPGPGSAQTVSTTAAGPTFGPRGLPCTPTSSGSTGSCPYLSSSSGTPTAFITFMQNTQSGNCEAVTVSPASRIRQWAYTSNAWSPLN